MLFVSCHVMFRGSRPGPGAWTCQWPSYLETLIRCQARALFSHGFSVKRRGRKRTSPIPLCMRVCVYACMCMCVCVWWEGEEVQWEGSKSPRAAWQKSSVSVLRMDMEYAELLQLKAEAHQTGWGVCGCSFSERSMFRGAEP
ncbi:hypothetical protein BR93DRAFT_700448 [Coniochaeta sp. PMI_546]|nr:hypothetical protein BR93DRAFT_700448 [Coniochaeta sp. PMI_546]